MIALETGGEYACGSIGQVLSIVFQPNIPVGRMKRMSSMM